MKKKKLWILLIVVLFACSLTSVLFNYKNIKRNIEIAKEEQVEKESMRKVGLDPELKKPVGKYSLGMKQRLAIAQATMENQDILILDEPMNGLDKDGVEQMRKLFLSFKEEGKTLLLASHNREDIELLCDEVYEMEHGRLHKLER